MVAECYIDECVLKIGNSSNSHKMVDLLGKPMIFCLFPVHFGEKFVASHPCEARFNAPGGLVISTDPRRVQGSRHFFAQE